MMIASQTRQMAEVYRCLQPLVLDQRPSATDDIYIADVKTALR